MYVGHNGSPTANECIILGRSYKNDGVDRRQENRNKKKRETMDYRAGEEVNGTNNGVLFYLVTAS